MAKVITTQDAAFTAFTQATQHAQSRAQAAEAERAATEAARLALPTQVQAITGPAVAAAQSAASLAVQRAGVVGSVANDAALAGRPAGDYRVGLEIVSWNGNAVTARTAVLASDADVQEARALADTASNALGNLALTTLNARTQADGPQLADGSRWVWRVAGTATPGLVVAAAGTGFWHREYDGAVHTRWAIPDPAALTATQRRVTLQALIDGLPSGEIVFDAVYVIDNDGVTYPGMGSGVGLRARDNQVWRGPGGVRFADGVQSNLAIISNASATITNFQLDGGFIIDGNRAAQGWNPAVPPESRTNGALLFGPSGCRYADARVRDVSASGLLMRANGAPGLDNRIVGATVQNVGYIGIQCQQLSAVHVTGNTVRGCGDNGVDIEGDDPAGGFENAGRGHSVIVGDNIIDDVSTAVFLESTGRAIVSGNQMTGLRAIGVFANRVNSGSVDNIITNNIMRGTATAVEGVRFANNTGRSIVGDNRIEGFDHGITLAGGITYTVIRPNLYSGIRKTIINPLREVNALVKSIVERQYYAGQRDANGIPHPFSPFNEPLEQSNRLYKVTLTPVHDLENAEEMSAQWYYRETATANNAAWAAAPGVAAIYFNNETIINIPANGPSVGDYLRINNVYYRVHATAGAEVTVRDSAGVAGDFRAALSSPAPVFVYRAGTWTAMRSL